MTRRVSIEGAAGALSALVLDGRGDEPALLFVHPANLRGVCWLQVAAALGPAPTCIMVDLRGHGDSHRGSCYGVAEWAEDCRRALLALADGPVHLIGASAGAAVAVRLAADEPGLVASVGAVGGAFLPAPAEGDPLLAALEHRALDDELRRWMACSSVAPGTPPATVRRIAADVSDNLSADAAAVWRAALSTDVRGCIDALRAPCWVAVGEHDRSCPPQEARWFSEAVGASLHVLPGVGHLPMYEAPELLADLIAASVHAAYQE